jgi:hypothetical protein
MTEKLLYRIVYVCFPRVPQLFTGRLFQNSVGNALVVSAALRLSLCHFDDLEWNFF